MFHRSGAGVYLRPVVLEHNHAGLWIHPFEDQRLPIWVSIGNHGGHHGDRIVRGLNHVIGGRRTFLTAYWCNHNHGRKHNHRGPEDAGKKRRRKKEADMIICRLTKR